MLDSYRRRNPTPWTSEEDFLLRQLWEDNKISAAMIAEKMPIRRSKNAIVGRAHRLGLPKKRPSAHHSPTNKGVPRNRGRRIVVRPMLNPEPELVLPLVVPTGFAPIRISLIDISVGQCRAVVESSQANIPHYCGHPFPIDRRISFCDYHMSIYTRG